MIELRTYQDLAYGAEPTVNTGAAVPAEGGNPAIPGTYASTTWSYNGRNQLIRKEYHDDNGTNYTYTPAGRLKTRQWARGNWTRYDYDVAGALSATLYFTAATTESAVLTAAAGNDPLTPDVIVSNDKLGRPSTVTQTNQSTLSYVYDQSTLLLDKETTGYDTDADGTVDFSRTLDRSVDGFRRSTGWELKNGTTVEHSNTYDYRIHDNRLNTVTGNSQSHTYGYEPGSYRLVKTVTSPAHTVTNKYEDTRNVLEQKKNALPSVATPVSQFDYSVNDIGQRENLTTAGSAFSTAPAYTWTYNAAGELIQADNDRSYSYDKIGNRITAGSTNYTADKLNQYTAIGTLSPAYDADGNMISGPLPSHLSANSILVWDGENRLVSVTVNSVTTNYEYDAHGRRISKKVGAATATRYIYDAWNMIAEYTGTTLSKSYTWGMDLSGSMQGAGGVGGLLSVQLHTGANTGVFYPSYDGNGNVSEYLDSSGAKVAHYEYDAFGNEIVSATSGSLATSFAHKFSTKPVDTETGLYYYGYRYYNPVTGKWPSRDPIEEGGGVNLYLFVQNDGLNWVDILGLEPDFNGDGHCVLVFYDGKDTLNQFDNNLAGGDSFKRSAHELATGGDRTERGEADKKNAVDVRGNKSILVYLERNKEEIKKYVSKIYIVDHGSPGSQAIGNDEISEEVIKKMADVLGVGGTIIFCGCEVSKGQKGSEYMGDIAKKFPDTNFISSTANVKHPSAKDGIIKIPWIDHLDFKKGGRWERRRGNGVVKKSTSHFVTPPRTKHPILR
ncbi:DUF4347 domain-containing protein [Verrucomicrobiaceae bacterium R5-34]|nr:DUF4347 domain-containing protein [Verrucomicrobiaceae bacterium R5-34]